MPGRETGPVFKRLTGPKAQELVGFGRAVLGRLYDTLIGQQRTGAKTIVMGDGTVVRASYFGGLPIVSIVRKITAGCQPLTNTLRGYLSRPMSASKPNGFNDPNTIADHPEVVLLPSLVEGLYKYLPYFFNRSHNSSEVTAKYYQTQKIDTCGTKGDWHPFGLKYGNMDWRDENNHVLTWNGPPTRYFRMTGNTSPAHTVQGTLATQILFSVMNVQPTGLEGFFLNRIYYQGTQITGLDASGIYIAGAALQQQEDESWKLITVVATTKTNLQAAISQEKLITYDFDIDTGAASNAVVVATLNWTVGATPPQFANTEPWLFNASGTKAVATRFPHGATETGWHELDAATGVLTYIAPQFSTVFDSSNHRVSAPVTLNLMDACTGDPTPFSHIEIHGTHTIEETTVRTAVMYDYLGDVLMQGSVVTSDAEHTLITADGLGSIDLQPPCTLTACSPASYEILAAAHTTNELSRTTGYTVTINGQEIYDFELEQNLVNADNTSGDYFQQSGGGCSLFEYQRDPAGSGTWANSSVEHLLKAIDMRSSSMNLCRKKYSYSDTYSVDPSDGTYHGTPSLVDNEAVELIIFDGVVAYQEVRTAQTSPLGGGPSTDHSTYGMSFLTGAGGYDAPFDIDDVSHTENNGVFGVMTIGEHQVVGQLQYYQGSRFASTPLFLNTTQFNAATTFYTGTWANILTDSDPVTVTGLPGANPRFGVLSVI